MRKFRLAAFFLLSTVATAAGGAQSSSPTKGWPTATPQSVGLNVAVLESIHSEIAAGRYGYVDRMLVIRRGRVVYDKSYAHDYDRIYGDSARVRSPLDPDTSLKG